MSNNDLPARAKTNWYFSKVDVPTNAFRSVEEVIASVSVAMALANLGMVAYEYTNSD